MKLRATSPLAETIVYEASVTTKHPRSCFGNPVLVLLGPDGGAIGPLEAEFAGYEVTEATAEECRLLLEAGYRLKGLRILEAALTEVVGAAPAQSV